MMAIGNSYREGTRMPTPGRTSITDIVAAAREILEAHGHAGLTMQAVADQVGVRAPSLYKRVRNRDDLVRLVAEATIQDLGERLHAIPVSADARTDLAELARAFRGFAHARPTAYRLIFGWGPVTVPTDPDLLARAAAPVLRIAADLAGPENALEAARTLTAWANGFISMELAGAFNLGGDIESAFDYGVGRLADAFTAAPRTV
jgi:AcrR family transcriptional regulator